MAISIYHSFDLIFIDLFLISGKEHIKHHIKKENVKWRWASEINVAAKFLRFGDKGANTNYFWWIRPYIEEEMK